MRKILALLLFALLLPLGAKEIDPFLDAQNKLWEKSPEDLQSAFPNAFVWVDSAKTQLRYNARTSKVKLTLFDIPVQEILASVQEGKLAELDISVFNRGDAGDMERGAFRKLLATLTDKLNEFAGGKSQTQNAVVGAGKVRSQVWRTERLDAMLRWSMTKDTPEFVSVDLYLPGASPKSLRDSMKTNVGSSELAGNVKIEEDGTHMIRLPMVDQGAKGYCVAATLERVLRYYGSDVDQHIIAKLAESDAQRGTSFNKLIGMLETSQTRLGIRFKWLYRYDGIDKINDIQKLVKDYNNQASRMKLDQSKVDFNNFVFEMDRVRYLDFGTLMKRLDFNVFKEVRQKEREGKNFMETVKESIDEGIPLCWGTFIFPKVEGGAGSDFGLHMRIINGYNDKTDSIVYTDSWGANHEKKILPASDAWGITVNLVSLSPRSRKSK